MGEPKQLELIQSVRTLTPRERVFLKAYMETQNQADAYLVISPNIKRESAAAAGARLFRKIKDKIDLPDFWDELNLGIPRIGAKVNEMLSAKKAITCDGQIYRVPDNQAQMSALTLLADIHGIRKTTVEQNVKVDGKLVLMPSKLSEDEWQEQALKLAQTG